MKIKILFILLIFLFFINSIESSVILKLDIYKSIPEIIVKNGYLYAYTFLPVYPPELLIYSMKKNKLIKSIIRRGAGPGEFRFPGEKLIDLFFDKDKMIVSTNSKMVFYTLKGDFLYEKKFPVNVDRVILCGNMYVGIYVIAIDNKRLYKSVNLLNNGFVKIKELYKKRIFYPPTLRAIKGPLLLKCYNQNIFISDSDNGIQINEYNQKGNKIKTIKINYKREKINQEDKRRILEFFEKDFGTTYFKKIIFPTYYPGFKKIYFFRSRILVLRYHSDIEGKQKFILSDYNGNVLRRFYLPFCFSYSFNREGYYCVKKDKEGEFELVYNEFTLF